MMVFLQPSYPVGMPALFDPFPIRDLTLANRVVVSPMCEYSSDDGFAHDWHLVHLGSRAVGGAALVMTEATAVTPDGRISPQDLGIWRDEHVAMLSRITRFIHAQNRAAGMQLAHAGRKGSTRRPWEGTGAVESGGWTPVGPTNVPFTAGFPVPHPLAIEEIATITRAFADAARRALAAGFDVVEVHAAHGYLLHEFLSPLSNTRDDAYGGSFANRIRFCLEVVDAVRAVWPERLPVFVRISATDWTDGGWDIDQSVELARHLKSRGVDLIDCSSGGNVASAKIALAPGYQVPFAARIRQEARIATGAVGLITDPPHADAIVRDGHADCVFLARELLRDPYWPLRAARELDVPMDWPAQYLRAAPPSARPR
jgi:2,4-dienoyl-CoA reductase-like NADH-dependent reductase (Old Yellow Enzyme family)